MRNIFIIIWLFLLVAFLSANAGYYYGKNKKEKTDCVEVIDRLLTEMNPPSEKPLTLDEFAKLQYLLYARQLISGEKLDGRR